MLLESPTKLEIALLGEAELLRRLERPESFAFAFDEHRQFPCDFILLVDSQGSSAANESPVVSVPLHGKPS